jgi:hypothetical protein
MVKLLLYFHLEGLVDDDDESPRPPEQLTIKGRVTSVRARLAPMPIG